MDAENTELHPTQEEILAIIDDVGAATTRLLVHRLDDDAYRQLVNYHIRQLRDRGLVEEAGDRLYTLAEGGENE